MTPGKLRAEIIAERAAWVREMLAGLRALPLASYDEFAADPRNPAAAESFLRRALEALLDLARHVLAKGFGRATTEYKEIARALGEVGVLDDPEAARLVEIAGFRNRLVHFYQRLTLRELYQVCSQDAGDIETLLGALLSWVEADPARSEGEASPPEGETP